MHYTTQIWTDFHKNEAKKNFFLKKKIQNGRFFKMAVFQNRQFLRFFRENCTDWSLGLVELIDVKAFNGAQPKWS